MWKGRGRGQEVTRVERKERRRYNYNAFFLTDSSRANDRRATEMASKKRECVRCDVDERETCNITITKESDRMVCDTDHLSFIALAFGGFNSSTQSSNSWFSYEFISSPGSGSFSRLADGKIHLSARSLLFRVLAYFGM